MEERRDVRSRSIFWFSEQSTHFQSFIQFQKCVLAFIMVRSLELFEMLNFVKSQAYCSNLLDFGFLLPLMRV